MASIALSGIELLRGATPIEGKDLPSRVCVHQFLAKYVATKDTFGFKELSDVGAAVSAMRVSRSDAKLLALYDGVLIPDKIRGAIERAHAISISLDVRSSRSQSAPTLQWLATQSEQLAPMAGERFDSKSLPSCAGLYRRYEAAFPKLVDGVSVQKFGQLRITKGDGLKTAEKLVELAELGGSFSANEMLSADAGNLEGKIARARSALAQANGDVSMAAAKSLTDAFCPPSLRIILDYARRVSGEAGVQQAGHDLKRLAEFAASPDLGRKIGEFVANLARLADFDCRIKSSDKEPKPISGLGRVVENCIESMQKLTEGSQSKVHSDQPALRALNGFLAETNIATRLMDKGWEISGVDREVPMSQAKDPITKEIDIIARRALPAGMITLFVEVKDNWGAVENSLNTHGMRQLERHDRACSANGARPTLIIENASNPPTHLVSALNKMQDSLKSMGKPMFLICDGHFNSIPGVKSAKLG